MKKLSSVCGLMVTAVLLFVGCGILPTPTPTPTATPLPTETPLPTATALPTATRPPPTATRENALPPAIAFALNKTQGFRAVEFDFATGIVRVQDGKTTDLPGLAVKGQDSTLNRHVTVSGVTSDTNEFITYDVIVFGDKVFVKGLTGVPGIDPALWYELPAEYQGAVRRLPTARGLINSFNAQDFGAAKFQNSGTETLDGETCTVWAAQNPAAIQKIIGVTDAETLRSQLGEIDSSELQVWTCADGYIHKLHGLVRGHNAQNKNDTVSIKLEFAMNRFDQPLEIQAPPDAKPFAPEAEPTSAPPSETTTTPTVTVTATPSATPSTAP